MHQKLAGDKTAYLVTDLTVTAVTVLILNSGFLGQNCHCHAVYRDPTVLLYYCFFFVAFCPFFLMYLLL